MNTVTASSNVKVLFDTNILVSGLGFSGKPRQILNFALNRKLTQIRGVTSPVLLAELADVVNKKFPKLAVPHKTAVVKIRKKFEVVEPKKSVNVVRDDDDNRVLEAAVEGQCNFIITGDKDLLELKIYRGIKIVTASEFLSLYVAER